MKKSEEIEVQPFTLKHQWEVLLTFLNTFPMVLTKIICLTVKSVCCDKFRASGLPAD